MILVLLLACTDPGPVAVAACQALPGVAAHDADLPLLQTLLVADDIAALRTAEPTLGLQAVDAASLARLRTQTTCEAVETNGAGSGRWAVKLTRTAPTVNPDGTAGPPEEAELEWQVSDEDGGRVDLNLPAAALARKSIDAAAQERDWKRVSAGWRALARRFADPLLAVDVAAAEAQQAQHEYGTKLQSTFEGAGDGLVQATLENTGDRAVRAVLVEATFQTAGGPVPVEVELGGLAAGASSAYTVPIPEGAEGSVRLVAIDTRFAE